MENGLSLRHRSVYPNENRKESVATYPFAPAGATALSLCTVIHFWNWDMDLNSYSPILQKARQFALDGDYMSAQSYYEETKSLMEKDKKRLTTPSIKRVGMIVSIENRCTTRYPLNYPR